MKQYVCQISSFTHVTLYSSPLDEPLKVIQNYLRTEELYISYVNLINKMSGIGEVICIALMKSSCGCRYLVFCAWPQCDPSSLSHAPTAHTLHYQLTRACANPPSAGTAIQTAPAFLHHLVSLQYVCFCLVFSSPTRDPYIFSCVWR